MPQPCEQSRTSADAVKNNQAPIPENRNCPRRCGAKRTGRTSFFNREKTQTFGFGLPGAWCRKHEGFQRTHGAMIGAFIGEGKPCL
jgi:hypothetical protein